MPAIFADYNSTTPIAKPVSQVMLDWSNLVGNMSSAHQFGQSMHAVYDESVDSILRHLGAANWELLSCSSATEANNWLFYSLLETIKGCPRVITTAIEHPAVLVPLCRYHDQGLIDLKICPVDQDGFILIDEFESMLTPDTVLVSVMLANNEVGTIQPLKTVANMAAKVGAIVHSDIVQAAGKLKVDLNDLGVDAVSISGHKCYAPTGIGALLVKDSSKLRPMILGGSQQQMLRAGTVNVFGLACLSVGLDYCYQYIDAHVDVYDWAMQIQSDINDCVVISIPKSTQYLWNTVNIAFPGKDAHSLMMRLDMRGIAVSTGSACSTGAIEPSSVVQAMGYSPEISASAIRFSFGYPTTIGDLKQLIDVLKDFDAC